MRQKELRLAMVCYGGISLAVYMHGVTKEVWKLARASSLARDALSPSEAIYADMLADIAERSGVNVRVLPDIVAGASAGGLNGVFLAQAIHTGQSLEPLTHMWLEMADIDRLLPDETPGWASLAKQWAVPLVRMMLGDTGGPVNEEIRAKLNRLVRSRWFEAPFSGIGFSRMIAGALDAMADGPAGPPLLPPGHPVDLFTTATDFAGHAQRIALHDPAWVEEREHRVDLGFQGKVGGAPLGALPELVFAARATASFPGAFPPLQVAEIDALMAGRDQPWPTRAAFLERILPAHGADAEKVALMDGSILVNAPFAQAIAALPARPADNEIDRRLIYIDPTQPPAENNSTPGFFSAIFRALSTIPREQPVRDNLEALSRQSATFARYRSIMTAIEPDVERSIRDALGPIQPPGQAMPDAGRLRRWRAAAQDAAAREAGYAYQAYARLKLETTLDGLARSIAAAPGLCEASVRACLGRWAGHNLRLTATQGDGLSSELVAFLRAHDGAYRQRRLRHLIRRLDMGRQDLPDIARSHHDAAREILWRALSLALMAIPPVPRDAGDVMQDPGGVLRQMAGAATFTRLDEQVDALMAQALESSPAPLGQVLLLAYLGFAFYDVASLALTGNSDLNEMDPVKVDRISPRDMTGQSGIPHRLKGEEFHHFAAFFCRAYREHDYLLGRLHGARRMIDLLASTSPVPIADLAEIRQRLLTAILDEEAPRLTSDPTLIAGLRSDFLTCP